MPIIVSLTAHKAHIITHGGPKGVYVFSNSETMDFIGFFFKIWVNLGHIWFGEGYINDQAQGMERPAKPIIIYNPSSSHAYIIIILVHA